MIANNLDDFPQGPATQNPGRFRLFPQGFNINKRKNWNLSNKNYVLPTDNDEIFRLNFQHHILRHMMHGNFNAPVEDALQQGIKVLDAGCGGGKWSIEMATDYPNSTFYAVDIADVFPKSGAEIPSNLKFIRADTKDLPFEDNYFDFVYQRFMELALTPSEWLATTRELTRVLKPGGWLELVETSLKLELRPTAYAPIYDALLATTRAKGMDIEYATEVEYFLSYNGLRYIESDYVSCPIGWNGRVGDLLLQNMMMVLNALKPQIFPAMGISEKEYTESLASMRDEFGKNKTWTKVPYAYGMKPPLPT